MCGEYCTRGDGQHVGCERHGISQYVTCFDTEHFEVPSSIDSRFCSLDAVKIPPLGFFGKFESTSFHWHWATVVCGDGVEIVG